MSLFARIADVEVIVTNIEWETKGLTEKSFQDVYAPENPSTSRSIFGCEERIPCWTPM
jgi:hypothetical protein